MKPFDAWYLPAGLRPPDDRCEVEPEKDGLAVRRIQWEAAAVSRVLTTLREDGRKGLGALPVRTVVDGVDRVARRLLDPKDRLREGTLDGMASLAGYSMPMAMTVLDGMAAGWRADELDRLLASEFSDPGVLDEFKLAPGGGITRATGLPLAFHLGAGTVPGVAVTSLIRSLLVKSAVILRPSGGDLALAVAFARALAAEVPELADAMAVVHWPADATLLTETALSSVDLVVAYGGDETLRWIRDRLPLEVPLVAYRHRLGVGMVGREALSGPGEPREHDHPTKDSPARRTAVAAARAVALFDQRGCVSPHVIFVEEGGAVPPREWAGFLAEALAQLEQDLPSGEVSAGAGAEIQQLRGAAEVAEGLGSGWVRHGGADPWTVVILPDEPLTPSCLHRVVRVVPVGEGTEAVAAVEPWAPFLQSVGLDGFGTRAPEMEEALTHLGASRIVPLTAMPWPDPWWHHDGGSPLRDLVRWTDVERK